MPLNLVKRLAIGRKVTPIEEDQNFTDIENALNALTNALAVALNPNGTLKDNTVSTNSIQDRAVTVAKLAPASNFFAQDTGTTNSIVVAYTPPLTAYVQGLLLYVKVLAMNSGATVIRVDGMGPKSVKKYHKGSGGTVDLDPQDLIDGNIYILYYDGTRFLCLNPTPEPVPDVTRPFPLNPVTVLSSTAGPISWTHFDARSNGVPEGATHVILQFKLNLTTAADGESQIDIRADNGNPTYQGLYVAGVDGGGVGAQGIFPLDLDGKFDYQVVQTTPSLAEIKMIGYYAVDTGATSSSGSAEVFLTFGHGTPPTDGSILTQGYFDIDASKQYVNTAWPLTGAPSWVIS